MPLVDASRSARCPATRRSPLGFGGIIHRDHRDIVPTPPLSSDRHGAPVAVGAGANSDDRHSPSPLHLAYFHPEATKPQSGQKPMEGGPRVWVVPRLTSIEWRRCPSDHDPWRSIGDGFSSPVSAPRPRSSPAARTAAPASLPRLGPPNRARLRRQERHRPPSRRAPPPNRPWHSAPPLPPWWHRGPPAWSTRPCGRPASTTTSPSPPPPSTPPTRPASMPTSAAPIATQTSRGRSRTSPSTRSRPSSTRSTPGRTPATSGSWTCTGCSPSARATRRRRSCHPR
jgi:hypothetical protein